MNDNFTVILKVTSSNFHSCYTIYEKTPSIRNKWIFNCICSKVCISSSVVFLLATKSSLNHTVSGIENVYSL